MSTLFQIHSTIDNLKSVVKEMALLWHAGDSILLLGETVSYVDWLQAYIDELNYDDETDNTIDNISSIYVLSDDIIKLNKSATMNLDVSKTTSITDAQWVNLTLKLDRVVTLNLGT